MALELTQAEQMIMKWIWAEDESLSIDYSFVLEIFWSITEFILWFIVLGLRQIKTDNLSNYVELRRKKSH